MPWSSHCFGASAKESRYPGRLWRRSSGAEQYRRPVIQLLQRAALRVDLSGATAGTDSGVDPGPTAEAGAGLVGKLMGRVIAYGVLPERVRSARILAPTGGDSTR